MRKIKAQNTYPVGLKQKLGSTMFMLLFAAVLVTSASYAWFELITATETKHISANVEANGSLEVALLNADTRSNMSAIRADIGDSLAEDNQLANNSWGNLVDLAHINYGLSQIDLMPSRLNVLQNIADDGYIVDSGLLAVPTYGYDGRIIELAYNTVSAVYQEDAFLFKAGEQNFGVRGIGTSDVLSAQGSSLAMAKSNIVTNTRRAKNNAILGLNSSGESLFTIMMFHVMDETTTYTDEDRDAMKVVLEGIDDVLQDIESALREGIVAYAASQIHDETVFLETKHMAMDSAVELKQTVESIKASVVLPEEYDYWVSELDITQTNLNSAKIACEALEGNDYTWNQMRGVMNYIINVEKLMINDIWFEDMTEDAFYDMLGMDITLTLKKDSGIYADIAEFVDDFSAIVTVEIMDVMVAADNEEEPAYLVGLSDATQELKMAESDASDKLLPLTATYGYALDLAFRCNTEGADLMLQTTPAHRIYNQEDQEITADATMGSGSYMAFHTFDKPLADAIRVTFLDDQGVILGMAKLNTSQRTEVDHMIQVPLQLYDYHFETDDAGLYLVMGETAKSDATIVSKEQMTRNVPEAVTVVVWLDGDIVDNTMVSATEQTSLSGVMNLQFATSAKLVPTKDMAFMGYTADKTGLNTLLQACADAISAGRESYTTVSWSSFSSAYERAVRVHRDKTADEQQIRDVITDLASAKAELDASTRESVMTKVTQLRQQMGTLEQENARIVIQNPDGSYSAVGDEEHTQQEHDSWKIVGQINRVDYNNNLQDEGNGIFTPIYTEDSWIALANALYGAEAVLQNQNATVDQLDAALSAIETAESNLQRCVFFKPYTYQGSLWFEAICDAENADTYGKWYQSDFQRVISDLTIANLDAYAIPAELTEIRQERYVASDTGLINPDIAFLEVLYPQLQEETVKGVKWNPLDPELFIEVMNSRHLSAINELMGIVRDESLDVDISAAEALAAAYADDRKPTAEEADQITDELRDVVVDAMNQKAKEEATLSAEMTASQQILLITAVEKARSLDNWASNYALEQAVAEAEALLTTEETVHKTVAAEALSALNQALKSADMEEVTEYNTLTHKLPEGTVEADILYAVEYPDIAVQLTGKSGVSTIGAMLLTDSGIVISVSKEITVYDRADGLELYRSGSQEAITALELAAEETVALTVQLMYESGGKNTGNKQLAELIRENIKSFTWATADPLVASVTGKDAEVCTVSAISPGNTTIGVMVETVEGNIYTWSIPLNIRET